ncbi:uncharacterized protein BO96DRAFT_438716 [Aspergillus niger CBS 101883]|uniref:Uncharacterized protein n=2 Tax=Aspergillus niger TaxID=5061 RepID=A2R6A3_ASPNC|nr:uncharacterized protein BO96DRAFT_438716 [Aspergillus niger CBS 101883]XP_059605577.1 hypothetical protein An15g07180 [Aspergillus niger]PYH51659.1 hypothetical protein BO96DRAFT_438716 [Aspergillus niger CBS 101883]CAK48553.1 hypothetical protein An15g07180 [Aspergillus niger]
MQWSFFAGLAINGHMPYCPPFHWWEIPRKSYYCSTGSVELIHTMKIDPLRIAERCECGTKGYLWATEWARRPNGSSKGTGSTQPRPCALTGNVIVVTICDGSGTIRRVYLYNVLENSQQKAAKDREALLLSAPTLG